MQYCNNNTNVTSVAKLVSAHKIWLPKLVNIMSKILPALLLNISNLENNKLR